MEPPEDREMELREHLAELRTRVIRSLVFLLVFMGVYFYKSDELMYLYWNNILPGREMVAYSPTEPIVAKIVFSFFLAFITTYPYIMYEIYLFMKPGLYEHERKFMKTFIPLSYAFFLVGVGIAYFIILPRLYGAVAVEMLGAEPYLSIKKTLYNSLKICAALGLSMQLPVIAAIAVRIGLVSSKWLREKRLIIYLAVLILATNMSLDITGLSQIIVLAVFVVMYEISVFVSSLAEK